MKKNTNKSFRSASEVIAEFLPNRFASVAKSKQFGGCSELSAMPTSVAKKLEELKGTLAKSTRSLKSNSAEN